MFYMKQTKIEMQSETSSTVPRANIDTFVVYIQVVYRSYVPRSLGFRIEENEFMSRCYFREMDMITMKGSSYRQSEASSLPL